jgi:hypothetical protein
MLVAVAASAMLVSVAGSVAASELDITRTFAQFKLGTIPAITFPGSGTVTSATLTDDGFGGHILVEDGSIFSTTNYWVNSAAFTGFPAIDNLKISFHAGTGLFYDGFTAPNSVGPGLIGGNGPDVFGGIENITGTAILIAGGFQFTIDLSVLGGGGVITIPNVLNNTLMITGEPFGVDPVQITGITTNVLVVPGRGTTGVAFTMNLTTVELASAFEVTVAGVVSEANTVTINGFNNLQSASLPGTVKLASPFRLKTGNLAGNVVGVIYKTFTFVPEPGTMLLLVSGAVGLALIGRNRMRK